MRSRVLLLVLGLLSPVDGLRHAFSVAATFPRCSSNGATFPRRSSNAHGAVVATTPCHFHRRAAAVVLSEASTDDDVVGGEVVEEPVTFQERLRLFRRLALPYFQQAEGAKLNFGLMLLLVLINSAVSVTFSYVGRDFYSALSAKDQALFLEKTANFALGLAVATPLTVLYKFQRQRLALNWRLWMTTELARQYYSDQAYYKIEIDSEIDNPDQRITEDVTAFTKVSLDFFITLMTSVIDLVSFSGILYSIYPNLFYAIFVYAGVGSVTTIKLGQALIGQNAEQLLREADLRYSLVRLRENAESIAFYQGEAQEEAEVRSRLGGAVSNKRKILGTARNLEFFTVGYSYLIQILPVLVVSPLYFAGSIELGVITQSTGAFNHVLNDLSIIVNQFEGISSFSAGLGRLSKFVERMESFQAGRESNATFRLSEAHLARLTDSDRAPRTLGEWLLYGQQGPPPKPPPADGADDEPSNDKSVWAALRYGQQGAPPRAAASASAAAASTSAMVGVVTPGPSRIRNVEVPLQHASEAAPVLSVSSLSLLTPDGSRQLFADVSVDVEAGSHLLIMGNSGCGKSSMLRAVAGLWDRGSGEITRPAVAETMFLPQKPYCTLGSLRQQLVYPQTVEDWQRTSSDDALLRALRTVQLTRLAERGAAGLDKVRDWGDELSLGEQQRLAFARVLVNKPRLAILDEATSALDLNNEAIMYRALSKLPGITFLSVGHRPSLLAFHRQRLRLFGMDETPSFVVEAVDDALVMQQNELEATLAL